MSKKGKAAGGAGIGVILLVLLALLGGGFGLGIGGNGSGDGDNSDVIEDNQDNQNTDKEDEEENTTVLKVTVSGSDYYYDNEKISFDNLISEIESEDGTIIVEITDEDAGRNAYQKLIDKLDDLYIDYRER